MVTGEKQDLKTASCMNTIPWYSEERKENMNTEYDPTPPISTTDEYDEYMEFLSGGELEYDPTVLPDFEEDNE